MSISEKPTLLGRMVLDWVQNRARPYYNIYLLVAQGLGSSADMGLIGGASTTKNEHKNAAFSLFRYRAMMHPILHDSSGQIG